MGRVRIDTVSGQRFLAVEPIDPGAILARSSPVRRWLMRVNRRAGFEIMNIPESMLSLSLEDLVDVIRAHNPRLVIGPGADGDHDVEKPQA